MADTDTAPSNDTPATGDKGMVILKNPVSGKEGKYDPRTAAIMVERKGFKRVGTSTQIDSSLAGVVTKK